MSRLRPCPFCGGEAEIVFRVAYYPSGALKPETFVPRCKDRHCLGRLYKTYPTRKLAEDAWNRRAE